MYDLKVRVSPEDYIRMKKDCDGLGMSCDHLCPVDLNGAYVPMTKNGKDNLEIVAEDIKERFGLK